ncbi:MAG: NAD(P)H-dependent oxidoreductase subunit E [Deltaproteobacteria bacterium]|nr:NAD(P)H-dependent oxidoreductase subunit E [Deltaproteobacteria bacterium]
MNIDQLDSIIESWNGDRANILPILQDVQKELNYLPRDTMVHIAKKLGVTLGHVSSMATFFSSFSLSPRGKHIVTVCMGTACHVRGAPRVLEEFERNLEIRDGENTPDMQFSIETVNCVGACALGPLVIIDGNYHGNISTSEVSGLVSKYREK